MKKLSDRVEALVGPNAAIFEEAFWAVNPNYADIRGFRELLDAGAFLDAAMSLVAASDGTVGELWKVGAWDDNGVYAPHIRATAWVYGAPRVYAATPALALCAAALRARGL